MRVLKAIVGWLSVVSVALAVGFGAHWLYLRTAPFFRGAAVYLTDTQFPESLRLGSVYSGTGGLHWPSGSAWKMRLTGWQAAQEAVEHGLSMTESAPPGTVSDVVAQMVVVQVNDKTAAMASPRRLLDQMWYFGKPGSVEWQTRLLSAARRYAPDAQEVHSCPIRDTSGRDVGTLAIVTREPVFAVIPYSALVPSRSWEGTSATVGVLALVASVLLLVGWVGLDAAWRGMRPFAWGALVLLTNWIGLLAYLTARLSPPTDCPNCGEQVLAKYRRCPVCGVSLLTACPVCRTHLKPGWQYCPACTGVAPQPTEPAWMAAPSQRADLVPPGKARLTINVLDAQTGTPAPNARISIQGPSVLEGLTNRGGVFEARSLRSGAYTVEATKPGHEPAQAQAEVAEESWEAVQLVLRALSGKIVGRVVERHSLRPVAGARVYLDSARVDRSAPTSDDGRFVLDDVAPGPYTVCVEAEGFAPQPKLAEVAPGQHLSAGFALDPAGQDVGTDRSVRKENGDDTV
jgi:predicted RNA-binding Zn-ribbon protein involved in translation (DUF1610 family)